MNDRYAIADGAFELVSDRARSLTRTRLALIRVLLAFLAIYAFYPSESSSERFSLLVRFVAFGVMASLAVVRGSARQEVLAVFSWVTLFFVLAISSSNMPYFSPRVLNTISAVIFAAAVVSFTASDYARFICLKVFDFLLILAASCIFIQIFLYLSTGYIIEIHGAFFPWGLSRSAEIEKFGIARLSGMFTEPGTHSVYVFGLLICRALYSGKVFDRISVVGVASIASTLSVWGVGVVLVYCVAYFVSAVQSGKSVRNFLGGIATLFFFLIFAFLALPDVFIENILQYFEVRSQLTDGSGSSKVTAWLMAEARFDEVAALGLPVTVDFCDGCYSPQDAGLVLSFSMYFGMLAAFVFFSLYFLGLYWSGGWGLVVFGAPFPFSKFFYFDPLVWIIFFSALVTLFRKRF